MNKTENCDDNFFKVASYTNHDNQVGHFLYVIYDLLFYSFLHIFCSVCL